MRKRNGGVTKYGDCSHIEKKYHMKGITKVTADNLHYSISSLFKSGKTKLASEIQKLTDNVQLEEHLVGDGISSLTEAGKSAFNWPKQLYKEEKLDQPTKQETSILLILYCQKPKQLNLWSRKGNMQLKD
jgi:hypothetical protein